MKPVFTNIIFTLLALACGLNFDNLTFDSNSDVLKDDNPELCLENNASPFPVTSTGDVLGFYTPLSFIPGIIPVEVVSFPTFSGGTTTLAGSWSLPPVINFSITNIFTPTNTSAYNPVLKELVCLISSEQQLLEYEDINMTAPAPLNVFPTTATAPVFFNNSYFAIEIENNGYADLPLFEANIVNFDYQTATFSSVLPLQYTAPTFSSFDHESMSSATNITDELYFLSGSNLVIVTDLSFSTPAYCWIDLAPGNFANHYFSFSGVEYKSPGILLAIRETYTNGNITATDLVEIYFNSTTCSVSGISVVYDLMNNFVVSPDNWIVNSDYYSTTYDKCRQLYYLSTLFSSAKDSRLVEIDVQNATHVEQILPGYLFGIEWKQNPCPCEANFVYQQFSSCDKFNFINTSTGSTPMTCHWDFGDPNSGTNNTSAQCVDMHQFSTCGTFNVCLTINANGCTDNFCQTITVTDNVPPVALCKSGVVIALDANCMAILQPSDIDNGSSDNCLIKSLSLSQWIFNACGNYNVTFLVTDWCGNAAVCFTNVQVVDNFPPVIICPADKYLSTIDPSCTIIVNGLQWIALADNCGTPTITYTVTGDTQHSGVGDASGLLFNEGVSIVTYTATDNCGNSTQCTFKVDVTCLCDCPNNLIQNPGFNIGAVYGHFGVTGQTNNWLKGIGLPLVAVQPGCCDPAFIYLNSSLTSHESVYQTGLPFFVNKKYKISFCARKHSINGPSFQYNFTTTSSPVSSIFDPLNCINCENIGSSTLVTTNSWSSFTLPIWNLTSQNRDVLFISILGISRHGHIDNICIEEVFYICCSDENAFIDNSNNAVNVRVDEVEEQSVVEIGNLLECNMLTVVDWGDGSDTTGPFGANIQLRHQYPDSNKYEIKVIVQELDSSGQVCFETIISDSSQIIKHNTKYIGTENQSTYNPNSGITKWSHDFISRDKGGRINVEASKYNIETALLKPIIFPDPVIEVVNDAGDPVSTEAGEVISFVPDDAVAEKIELLFPAPAGYSWIGYQSNLLTPTSSTSSHDLPFTISFTWLNLPAGSQDSSGHMWISDNKDELYGEQILDGFGFFPPAELDTTTAIGPVSIFRNIKLYPNPAKDEVTINWGDYIPGDVTVEIVDCSGRLVQRRNIQADLLQTTIDVSMLHEGLYFIKVLKSSTPVRVLKFVKAR